jgi:hypothetical protein
MAISAALVGMMVAGGAFADWDNNPSFEVPYTAGWASYTPGETTNSTDFAFDGLQSLKFATPVFAADPVPGGNLPIYTVIDSPHNAATPGVAYTASARYYVDSALLDHERLGIGIFWYKLNSGGTALEFSSIDPGGWSIVFGPETATGFPTGEEVVQAWTPIAFSSTAPADAQFLAVSLEVRGGGSDVYFDGVTVIPEPASILLVSLGLGAVALVRRSQLQRG